jgi:hypothetical protein
MRQPAGEPTAQATVTKMVLAGLPSGLKTIVGMNPEMISA